MGSRRCSSSSRHLETTHKITVTNLKKIEFELNKILNSKPGLFKLMLVLSELKYFNQSQILSHLKVLLNS